MGTRQAARRWRPLPHGLFFALWLLAQWLAVGGLARQGQRPVDFLAYERAAATVARGASPYGTLEEVQTPMQGLVNLGMPPDAAQWAALALWLLPLGATLWWARGRSLGFPLAFALAFILLYWGRPVGWGLPFLDVVVLAAAWPTLARRGRALLLAAAVALLASHWGALALSVAGRGLLLFTLQRPEFPWETWLVLPACWLLLLRGRSAPHAQAQSVRNVHPQ